MTKPIPVWIVEDIDGRTLAVRLSKYKAQRFSSFMNSGIRKNHKILKQIKRSTTIKLCKVRGPYYLI